MPMVRGYKPNDRKVICDICGQTWRFSDMRRGISDRQKGLEVCPRDFDEIHPLEAKVPRRKEGTLDEVK